VFHGQHNHGEEILSGVYYVSVPPGSGQLEFHDPRGPHAPFQNKIAVHPREGDFVFFPTYLLHQVLPSHSPDNDPRISVAVNIGGDEQEHGVPRPFMQWPISVPTSLKSKGGGGRGEANLEAFLSNIDEMKLGDISPAESMTDDA